MTFRLRDEQNREYLSDEPGTLGGNSHAMIYGRLDCPAAIRALPRGKYQKKRVFFKDERTAIRAGYRPCGCCLPERKRAWKAWVSKQQLGLFAPSDAPGGDNIVSSPD